MTSNAVENSPPLLSASEIPVCSFREILLWPFVLQWDEAGGKTVSKCMADIARAINKEDGWEKVPDLVDHVTTGPGTNAGGEQGRKHPQAWAEIVYFHDFVQRTLYRKTRGADWPDATAPMLLLRNTRLKGLKAVIKSRQLDFAVERLNLYLFASGVAILALEVELKQDAQNPVHLNDIQNFMDFFRRWHVPFWESPTSPGLIPVSIGWEWKGSQDIAWFDPAIPNFHKSHEKLLESQVRAPHPLRHWLEILPLAICEHLASSPCKKDHIWRAISDERMVTLNFIIVPGDMFGKIRESDWVRLCFADQEGGENWPYLIHDGNWESFRKAHVFDWFHREGARQLFAGFNHTMVCKSGWFPENILVHHFRRHYFQMALLAQMEFATLLAFSSRISRAMPLAQHGNDEAFRELFIGIRRDFLHFVHEFRFTGVSNQMQARAMYDLWRKQLGLHELYHDVEDELRTGNDYLLAIENRERTETAGRLNIIVAILGLLGLVMAYATSDKSSFDTVQRLLFGKGAHEWLATFAMTSLGVLSLSLLLAPLFLSKENERNSLRPIGQYFGYTMAALACLAVLGLLF